MKKGTLLLCCFSLVLVLSSVTSIQDLNTIEDLKNTKFGKQYPSHGLMLLHWFANNIEIDQNNVIQRLNFRPGRGDYGFQYHSLPIKAAFPTSPLFTKHSVYYAFGNLHQLFAKSLPSYVTQDYYNSEGNSQRNIDRLVIKVQRDDPQRVEDVYISHHYESIHIELDPDNSHRVSPQLLGQIKSDIKNSFLILENNPLQSVYPPVMGLTDFLIEAGYDTHKRVSVFSHSLFCFIGTDANHRSSSLDKTTECQTPNMMKLEVKSTSNGYAKISWSGIPKNIVKMNSKIGLYKDGQSLTVIRLDRTSRAVDTDIDLNPGLQVKLLTTDNEEIWVGREFDEANSALPTEIKGFDASLQLFTKDGYACARLFIKKTFSNWKAVFKNSWVGFYKSSRDSNKGYKKYQWSVNFKMNANQDLSEDYDIYEYESSLAVGPGVQARFLLDKGYTDERARTEPWDGVIDPPKHEPDGFSHEVPNKRRKISSQK